MYLQAKNKKTLFVQLILDNIWTIYDAVLVSRYIHTVSHCHLICHLMLHALVFKRNLYFALCCCDNSDKEMTGKIVRSLDLKLPPVVSDAKAHLQSLFNQWLPLSQAVLGTDWRYMFWSFDVHCCIIL